jgi:hypothetical protein
VRDRRFVVGHHVVDVVVLRHGVVEGERLRPGQADEQFDAGLDERLAEVRRPARRVPSRVVGHGRTESGGPDKIAGAEVTSD